MMMGGNHKSKLGGCILFFIILFSILSNVIVDGRRRSAKYLNNIEKLAKPDGTVKTIKVKNGDVIDCVDIYKQPALGHPLLKNHTIQIKPSSYPRESIAENSEVELLQEDLLQDCQCPEGTIPISRTQINIPHSSIRLLPGRSSTNEFEDPPGHEYALVYMSGGHYFGAQAQINVWKPATFDKEFSLAQIWVAAGHDMNTNTMEAGWQVNAVDNQTRFFIFWTGDQYHRTGCYNLKCPGFVQTNRRIVLGSVIRPLSTYGGKQFEIFLKIYKDKKTGNWWLKVQNQVLGYWPRAIFRTLADSADRIIWGGEVLNPETHGRHTSTQMGSGHFPDEGFGKASHFRRLGYADAFGAVKDPQNLISYASKPLCYNVQLVNNRSPDFGTHFYFGGPGYSNECLF